MGKVIKANLNGGENKEENKMEENKVENNAETPAQENGENNQMILVNPKELEKLMKGMKKKDRKKLLDILWKDRGIFGKGITISTGAGLLVLIGFGVKALVAAIFGPEAAEMIDPAEMVPTEE